MTKHYHFIGIGGIGMAGLAALVLEQGNSVSGSDLKQNSLTEKLKANGARISSQHRSENITDPDFVVISSAIKKNNEELRAARAKRIPVLRRAELLARLMENFKGITVGGAHGKTTTSSMITFILDHAGADPGSAVGGIVSGLDSNSRLGAGDHFVAEVDESDGSFLLFRPEISVITNIDKEHLDHYTTFENILKAYKEFISNTSADGTLIYFREDEHLRALAQASGKTAFSYGFDQDCDIRAEILNTTGFKTMFKFISTGECLGEIQINLPGRHNVLNALAATQACLVAGVPFEQIREGFSRFHGVRRRFQLIGEKSGIRIVDDYAHHPTEISSTLNAARSVDADRVIAVFQPHRYSRFESLYEEFKGCFDECDYLIVTDVYAAGEKPIEGITPEQFALEVQAKYKKPVVYLKRENIVNHLLQTIKAGDIVLTLGAGDVTRFAVQLHEQINGQRLCV